MTKLFTISFFFQCMTMSLLVASNGNAQVKDIEEVKVFLNLPEMRVDRAFKELEKQTDFNFVFENREIRELPPIAIHSNGDSLYEVLSFISTQSSLKFKQVDNNIHVNRVKENPTPPLTQQTTQMITGTVTDQNGMPLPGATISVQGASLGTVTDIDGNFSIDVPEGSVLVFSYIGYETQTVKLGTQSVMNIQLSEDASSLEEVLVVGYGTQAKSKLTGSISSIDNREFENQPVTRLDQVLQGRAAGVQVTNSGGAPGGEVRIRIRGANSITGSNDPLYVIDGYVGADFSTVNPNDIESLQVLKDAASTAIYGSRGANGVIIITTKRGQKGDIKVNYNNQFSFSEVLRRYDTMGAAEFAEVANERSEATGLMPLFSQDQLERFRREGGTDWQDEIFRTATGQEHQISVSGGSEKTTFMVSANILDQDGIIENSGFKRQILRANLSTEVNERLSFRVNMFGSRGTNQNTSTIGFGTASPLVQALAWAPTTPIFNSLGEYTMNDPVGSVKENPVALLYDRMLIEERTTGNVLGGLNYKLADGLSLDVQYAVNYFNQQNKFLYGTYVTNRNPRATRSSSEQITLQSTSALTYKKELGEGHLLDVVGVFETQEFTNNSFSTTANQLKDPSLGFENIGLAGSFNVSSAYQKWTLMSFLGRVNYSFQDKYLLTMAIRRDGSSKFREDNRWSVFPSIAGGWNISEESFMQGQSTLSLFKIRGSWGITGSQAINPYATQSTYRTDPLVSFNGSGVVSGIMLGNPGNPNLMWETTEQSNIGVEMEFLDGALYVEGDVFVKNTRDLLINQQLPGYVGAGFITRNLGKVQNKGWEVTVSANIFKNRMASWTSSFNISDVRNEVVSLGGIADRIFTNTNVGAGMSTQSEYVVTPGSPLGSYWGLNYLGTWKPGEESQAQVFGAVPGDSRYEDLNNDGAITSSDFQVIGTGIPTTSLGWNNTVNYKSFTLNVFFQGVFGFDKLHYTRAAAISGSADARQPVLSEIRDRYIPGVNETSDIPAFSLTNLNFTQSTRFLESGDFLRLKNVSLSYDFPTQWIKNVANLRVFVSGINLWTITNYSGIDPESSSVHGADTALGIDYGAYPNARIITTGINLSF
ncbi:SusC/RagA family TonB-linked outer membrane protein [Pleomorphovibrio marinus]|uniref:SusC/RagA family TonB-linked outer membrane protein n=1 Tax=Pleomorphovibrio marinus TaxID=2164132 RepID=UPI0018E587DB|nr:SusC/RagA family TonB-linked outer membrane protein [Pleomorphovibrio marinus]